MTGDPIPHDHHVSRHCGPNVCPDGDVQGTAFHRKPDERGMSVNCLEYTRQGDRQSALRSVIGILRGKGRKIKPTSYLAVLNVGEVIQRVVSQTQNQTVLAVTHFPELPLDDTHVEMSGMAPADEFVGELLAECARKTGVYLVSSLSAR